MKKHCLGLLAAVASVAALSSANGADLAVKAPVYKAPPVIVSNWAGFYLGVAGGYGWGATSFDPGYWTEPPTDNAKPKGGLFGGYAGYNWQFGTWVAGVEADFSGADIQTTSFSATQKTDELGSVRGRLGYTIMPSLLAYGTAGAGWGHTSLTTTSNLGPAGLSSDFTQVGWVAGAGLEYKVWGNFIARAEYLHYDFGKESFGAPIPQPGAVSETIDVVRGGVSYKF